MANKDYNNTRAAQNARIDSSNVNRLGVAWAFPIPGSGPNGAAESNPIIANGTVYFQDLGSNVFALSLRTGQVIWQRIYNEPALGPNGPAIGYDKVFAQAGTSGIKALDRRTGKELWSTDLKGLMGTQQPYVFNGYIYTGTAPGTVETQDQSSTIRSYAPGTSGSAYAIDQQDGNIAWEFQVVEQGFWGHPEVNSGGGVRFPPAIDTESGLTYWGTGNPAPFPGTVEWPNGSSRPGSNLYTDSMLALNSDTGTLDWYTQIKGQDLFGHGFEVAPILTAVTINGEQRNLIIGAGKAGRVVAFDVGTGEVVWETWVGEHQSDGLTHVPPGQIIDVLPGFYGGVASPMALADGVLYVPAINLATPYTATGFGARNGTDAERNAKTRTDLAAATSVIMAINAANGDILWRENLDAAAFGGATVVNDLVFTSTFDGTIYALNRKDGSIAWKYQAPTGIRAWPAVVGDTIVIAAGVGNNPMLIGLRLGAQGRIPTAQAAQLVETQVATAGTACLDAHGTGTPIGSEDITLTPGNQHTSTVQVKESEYEIRMPVRIPAGRVAFQVTNVGNVPHNLEVTGQGVRQRFDTDLDPGETRTMVVDLAPGAYDIYCPLDRYAEQGMQLRLVAIETDMLDTPSGNG